MIWVQFIVTTILLVTAAIKLSQYGDVIGTRTKLGGAFVGTLLLAGATSLPELLTAISAIDQGEPELTIGNFFGSSMFNMLIIAGMDLFYRQGFLLKRVAVSHALTASLAVLLTGASIFFIQADLGFTVAWVGVDSLLLLAIYFYGTYLIQMNNSAQSGKPSTPDAAALGEMPSLRAALIGFAIATVVLVIVTPLLVDSAIGIAEITGLSTGFIGTALVAVITSLPEVVTTVSAARIGAYDLAVGNLFGSNVFNIFALGAADFFYTDGSLLLDLDAALALAGLIALLMTGLGLMGNLARVERRNTFVKIDAALLIIIYLLGMVYLYNQGISI